jgi:hypothetical protein
MTNALGIGSARRGQHDNGNWRRFGPQSPDEGRAIEPIAGKVVVDERSVAFALFDDRE